MESRGDMDGFGRAYNFAGPAEGAEILLLCEHASRRVPAFLGDLGLAPDILQSHIAWDPGALGVAQSLRERLAATLISGNTSRLVYDCNRPPDAASAVPARSEIYDVPGNTGLNPSARAARVKLVYEPFVQAVSHSISQQKTTLQLLVTIHSFTPVFHGRARKVQIGILFGRDDRFARAMMTRQPADATYDARLNEPYSAKDGVTHSIDLHGVSNGLLNVMIEIRNDLIGTPGEQADMAAYLAPWITGTLDSIRKSGVAA